MNEVEKNKEQAIKEDIKMEKSVSALKTQQLKGLEHIIDYAFTLGVSDVKIISPDEIIVDEQFPKYCREPGCPGYGMSMSCPPNVGGPEWFRHHLRDFDSVLVFKFDVPSNVLLSDERHDVTRLIHETVSSIEDFAKENGCTGASGFAGGSCKQIFCSDHNNCRVLFGDGVCRNPQVARPSMSGMGVDFQRLSEVVQWKFNRWVIGPDSDKNRMGLMAGMVLLSSVFDIPSL